MAAISVWAASEHSKGDDGATGVGQCKESPPNAPAGLCVALSRLCAGLADDRQGNPISETVTATQVAAEGTGVSMPATHARMPS